MQFYPSHPTISVTFWVEVLHKYWFSACTASRVSFLNPTYSVFYEGSTNTIIHQASIMCFFYFLVSCFLERFRMYLIAVKCSWIRCFIIFLSLSHSWSKAREYPKLKAEYVLLSSALFILYCVICRLHILALYNMLFLDIFLVLKIEKK